MSCDGCRSELCDVLFEDLHNEVKKGCPCSNCIVKVVCQIPCENMKIYFDFHYAIVKQMRVASDKHKLTKKIGDYSKDGYSI